MFKDIKASFFSKKVFTLESITSKGSSNKLSTFRSYLIFNTFSKIKFIRSKMNFSSTHCELTNNIPPIKKDIKRITLNLTSEKTNNTNKVKRKAIKLNKRVIWTDFLNIFRGDKFVSNTFYSFKVIFTKLLS